MLDSVAIGYDEFNAHVNSVAIGRNAIANSNELAVAWGSPTVQVTIHNDGKIDFPPGWAPDEAGKAFWKAVSDTVVNSYKLNLDRL